MLTRSGALGAGKEIYTAIDDGLVSRGADSLFMNPPFGGRIRPCVVGTEISSRTGNGVRDRAGLHLELLLA